MFAADGDVDEHDERLHAQLGCVTGHVVLVSRAAAEVEDEVSLFRHVNPLHPVGRK